MREAERVQKLITGGASHREARLRALEDMVETMAAERSRAMTPRPLDIPGRPRFDPSVVDMRGRASRRRTTELRATAARRQPGGISANCGASSPIWCQLALYATCW